MLLIGQKVGKSEKKSTGSCWDYFSAKCYWGWMDDELSDCSNSILSDHGENLRSCPSLLLCHVDCHCDVNI